jgi:hypothetical protein
MSDAAVQRHEVVPEAPGLGLLGPRTRHLLALEFGSQAQFDDPRLEWRRLFSELLGTFALVLVAAGAVIAVGCAFVLRGRGGDAIAYAAGSGVLDEGSLAAKQRLSRDIDRGEVVPPASPTSPRRADVFT